MDQAEALRLLRGGIDGVTEWNHRREQDKSIFDLRDAPLQGADLRYADFRNVDLTGASMDDVDLLQSKLDKAILTSASLRNAKLLAASLVGADLRKADFLRANLRSAILRQSDLRGASLGVAVLRRADLRGADLRGSTLGGADFHGAILGGADLSGAVCRDTRFSGLDLSQVVGLGEVQHSGPSSIDTETLFRSKGRIPETFLRGCGVAEPLIANLSALVGAIAPIQFYSCFISYSTKDEEFAQRLYARMIQEKLRVWYAPQDAQGGRKLPEQIDDAIRVYDKLLLVLSENSVRSEWVKTELRKAFKLERLEGKRKLFPIGLAGYGPVKDWECFDADHGKDLAVEVREYFIPDFSGWKDHDSFEALFAKLIRDLRKSDETVKGSSWAQVT